jgi:hypothetical protein
MLSIKADIFYEVTVTLRHTQALIDSWRDRPDAVIAPHDAIDDRVLQILINSGEKLALLLRFLDARVTFIAAKEHLDHLKNKNTAVTYDEISNSYRDIDASLRRELSLIDLLVLRGCDSKIL